MKKNQVMHAARRNMLYKAGMPNYLIVRLVHVSTIYYVDFLFWFLVNGIR